MDSDTSGILLNATLTIAIDGAVRYRYSPQKAMAVAFHWPLDKDVDDNQDLQKATPWI
jgi:hypothetical protein